MICLTRYLNKPKANVSMVVFEIIEKIFLWLGSLVAFVIAGIKIAQFIKNRPKLKVDIEKIRFISFKDFSPYEPHPDEIEVFGTISNDGEKPITIKKVALINDEFKGYYKKEVRTEKYQQISNTLIKPKTSFNFLLSFFKKGLVKENKIKGEIQFIDTADKVRFRHQFELEKEPYT